MHGKGMSGGFMIFSAGEKRLIFEHAQGMWHELMTGSWFKLSTPSGTVDEAEELMTIQNNITDWLTKRSNLDHKTISENVRKKNWYMSGKQMVEWGFADGFIGGLESLSTEREFYMPHKEVNSDK